MHPIVAIVGRPNVGKSRLFNRFVGRRKAIVSDTPGVTRDRHYAQCDWCGREFIAVDTGGLEMSPSGDLEHRITKQSLAAIEEADVVVCLFDGQVEPCPADREVVDALRGISKPVIFAANKIDVGKHADNINPFYELGVDEMMAVSAEHGFGVDDLLDKVIEKFPEKTVVEMKSTDVEIAVVGRPNVGKSTLVNRLSGEERVVAHEKPGTTRDAIDVEVDFDGKRYLFIDTAGVKRRWGVSEALEKFTSMRSLRTIDRAKLVLQLIDASEGLTKQDMHIAAFAHEQGKGMILLVNKWDLMDADWREYESRLRRGLGDMEDIRLLPISALTGQNCLKVLERIGDLREAMSGRISTSELNRVVENALENHHLPVYRGNQVRIYYATQIGVFPPAFALFSNYPVAVPYAYRRYLMKQIMKALGTKGIPVKVVCRKK